MLQIQNTNILYKIISKFYVVLIIKDIFINIYLYK